MFNLIFILIFYSSVTHAAQSFSECSLEQLKIIKSCAPDYSCYALEEDFGCAKFNDQKELEFHGTVLAKFPDNRFLLGNFENGVKNGNFKSLPNLDVKKKQYVYSRSYDLGVLTSWMMGGQEIYNRETYKIRKIQSDLAEMKNLFGQTIQVSIVSEEKLITALDEILELDYLTLDQWQNFCFDRATLLTLELEKRGILPVRQYVRGTQSNFTVYRGSQKAKWQWHVTPLVLVEKNGQLFSYVIDPVLATRPLLIDEWLAYLFQHHYGKNFETYVYERFRLNDDYIPVNAQEPALKVYEQRAIDDFIQNIIYYNVASQQKLDWSKIDHPDYPNYKAPKNLLELMRKVARQYREEFQFGGLITVDWL